MEFTEYKEWKYKHRRAGLTIGLWRPFVVEEGFVKDYIRRTSIETDNIILY
jgi:hypothetical protein